MPTPLLQCDKCRAVLDGPALNTPAPVPCPSCGASLLTWVFPAFFRPPPESRAAESLAGGAEIAGAEAEAGCFFHPRKKAVVPCAQCGRFLCALCDLELHGRHLCPDCLRRGQQSEDGQRQLETERIFHDKLALLLSVAPIIAWPMTLLTAPAALYYAIRSWREPARSLLPRSHARAVFAILFASLQLAGWGTWFFFRLAPRFR